MRLWGKLPTPRPIKGILGEAASVGDEESSTVKKLLLLATISDSTNATERAAKAAIVEGLGRFIYFGFVIWNCLSLERQAMQEHAMDKRQSKVVCVAT
jgi:hypothetical protein